MALGHWQDDPTLSLELLKPRNEGSDANNINAHISGPHNGHTPAITTEIGCLSSPLVMDLRLGVKDWSKSAGWSCEPRHLRPRPGKKGPRNGVGPNGQNVGEKSPDWEIRASRPLPITNIRTATAGFPAAFLGPELDSGKQGFGRGGRHTYAWR